MSYGSVLKKRSLQLPEAETFENGDFKLILIKEV